MPLTKKHALCKLCTTLYFNNNYNIGMSSSLEALYYVTNHSSHNLWIFTHFAHKSDKNMVQFYGNIISNLWLNLIMFKFNF